MARKRRAMSFMRQPNAAGRRGTKNWIIVSQSFDTTGSVMGSPVASWAASGSPSLAAGAAVSLALAMIQPVAGSTTPTLGAMRIDRVKGCISVYDASGSTTTHFVAFGLYVAQLNVTASTWSVRKPGDNLEAQRDDYLDISAWGFAYPPITSNCLGIVPQFEIDLQTNIVIGAGEALVLTVHNPGGVSLNFNPYVRTLVGPVA